MTDVMADVKTFVSEKVEGLTIYAWKAGGIKCERCWKYHKHDSPTGLCQRCEEVISCMWYDLDFAPGTPWHGKRKEIWERYKECLK